MLKEWPQTTNCVIAHNIIHKGSCSFIRSLSDFIIEIKREKHTKIRKIVVTGAGATKAERTRESRKDI